MMKENIFSNWGILRFLHWWRLFCFRWFAINRESRIFLQVLNFTNDRLNGVLVIMDSKVKSEGAGFTGLNHGDASIFPFDLSIEWIAGGRFDSCNIAIFLGRGILPYGKVGEVQIGSNERRYRA